MTEMECAKPKKKRSCGLCGGKGEVEYGITGNVISVSCPACFGTGEKRSRMDLYLSLVELHKQVLMLTRVKRREEEAYQDFFSMMEG